MKINDILNSQYQRTANLLGIDAMEKLSNSTVAIFGLGGVGSYTTEALARTGIGHLDITDKDVVELSNLNRQLYALHSTIGKYKTEIAKERIKDINPDIEVTTHTVFVTPENIDEYDFRQFDCVVDAIDNVTAKLALIERCNKLNTPIISCMGTGNKLNPLALTITDIYSTTLCPLAKVMRRELRKRNIDSLPVLYSTEPPQKAKVQLQNDNLTRLPPNSTAFVPSVAGLIIASWVVDKLINK